MMQTNDHDALVQALVLAVTAPDDERSAQAVALGEKIAAGMTEVEVARAKREAEGVLAGQ